MKKVISFSIYKAPNAWENVMETSYEKYINGLKKNIKLISFFYPDWHIYIYHDDNFNPETIEELRLNSLISTKKITDMSISAMQWRFLPHDDEDVDLFIVRDLDSRITKREQISVNEWIDSGKILHIMRDHPHHHYDILGGMWGMRKQKNFNMYDSIKNWNNTKGYNIDKDWYEKWWDMNFLSEVIYKKFSENSFINSSFHMIESWAKPFTEERENNHFVGEIFLENDERHYHYKLL